MLVFPCRSEEFVYSFGYHLRVGADRLLTRKQFGVRLHSLQVAVNTGRSADRRRLYRGRERGLYRGERGGCIGEREEAV